MTEPNRGAGRVGTSLAPAPLQRERRRGSSPNLQVAEARAAPRASSKALLGEP